MTHRYELWDLVPAYLQRRDEEAGGIIRELLEVLSDQADELAADVDQLYRDLFVETASDDLLGYIGDLLGVSVLEATSLSGHPASSFIPALAGDRMAPLIGTRHRADVGETMRYRRGKGTLAILRNLADATLGWPTSVQEGFQHLGWAQFLDHPQLDRTLLDVREVQAGELADGPFTSAPRTPDVRPVGGGLGEYNIRDVGVSVWRIAGELLHHVPAQPSGVAPWQYTISPLGDRRQLWTPWRALDGDTAPTEPDLPVAIRRNRFAAELRTHRHRPTPRPASIGAYGQPEAQGPDAGAFGIYLDGAHVDPAIDPAAPAELYEPQIVCQRLDPWPADQPVGAVVAVDVVAGRVAIGDGIPAFETIAVSAHWPHVAPMGGGGYDRGGWAEVPADIDPITVGAGGDHQTLAAAIAAWGATPSRWIQILDSGDYLLDPTIEVTADEDLVITAQNQRRPRISTPTTGTRFFAGAGAPGGAGAGIVLNGLLIDGSITIDDNIRRFTLAHSTLVPGRRRTPDNRPATTEASLVATSAADELEVRLAFSICGAIVCPSAADAIRVYDSVIDGTDLAVPAIATANGRHGPRLEGDGLTVLGDVRVSMLEVSDAVFTDTLDVQHRQEGCLRYSYAPPASITPRRYRCQPELAIADAVERAGTDPSAQLAARVSTERRIQPVFTSARYGDPAYLQHHTAGPAELQIGAESGAEMGAYRLLAQPQRERNLAKRFDEYLPLGLHHGLTYIT